MTDLATQTLPKNIEDTYGNMIEFLLLNDWNPQKLPDLWACRAEFMGSNETKMACYAEVRLDEKFWFFIAAPFLVPADKRLAVAEFMTQANFNIRIGNFVLNFETGEALFKVGLDFSGTTLDVVHFRNAIHLAAIAMDKYLPGLQWVVSGEKSPEQAVNQIRQK